MNYLKLEIILLKQQLQNAKINHFVSDIIEIEKRINALKRVVKNA